MAEEGFLPRWFSQGKDVPAAAVALQAGLAVGVVWIADLRTLLGYIGFTLSLSAAATVAALIRLRVCEGPRASRSPDIRGYRRCSCWPHWALQRSWWCGNRVRP